LIIHCLQASDFQSSLIFKVRMYIWSNGFSLDDGPLRSFSDPQNMAFIQAVTSK